MNSAAHRYLGMPAVLTSRAIRKLYARIERVAPSNVAILIHGERGSGKELVARAIHHYSGRTSGPWVDLNCAALPEGPLEEELFGSESGGDNAPSRPGLFELAHQGTLFLDEIDALSPRLQARLLRVLDGVPFFRRGGTRKVDVDVRIIAATNADLTALVAEGRFDEELDHRLAQFRLDVPPLRERVDDIGPMTELFARQAGRKVHFTEDAMRALEAYDWPGNVRELQQLVTAYANREDAAEIRTLDLPLPIQDAYARLPEAESDLKRLYASVSSGLDELRAGESGAQGAMLLDMEKHLIRQVLDHTAGNEFRAAQLLGIPARELREKLAAFDDLASGEI